MKGWHQVLIGTFVGLIVGLTLGDPFGGFAFGGKLFVDLLKMLVGFVVFTSLVTGASQFGDPRQVGRLGLRTLLFFATATTLSIVMAFAVTGFIHPGSSLHLELPTTLARATMTPMALLSNLIPTSPIGAFAKGEILQIVVFGFFISLGMILAGNKAKPFQSFLESFAQILQSLTGFIMKLAPFGVFCIMASAVSSMGKAVILPMLGYVLCNWIGCILLMVIVYPLILLFVCKKGVFSFYRDVKEVMLFAMSTCSSSASLPLSLQCATEKLGVSPKIAKFVLSLGITLNMNGSVICQISAALFVAESYGIPLSFVECLILALTSILASIGVAGIPGSSMIMLSMVLGSVGLPIEGVALVIGVDRLRDMISTMCNITGDLLATLVIGRRHQAVKESPVTLKVIN